MATRGIGSEFALSPRLLRRPMSAGYSFGAGAHSVWLGSGRGAILWAIKAVAQKDPHRKTWLLPGYLCPSVLQPFVQAGRRVDFYRLDNSLNVDVDDVRSRMTSDTAGVLVIHYFGFPQSCGVLEFLDTRDPPIWVIEDLSHAWLSASSQSPHSGKGRRISICSVRKFGPVPDAGIAVYDNDRIHPSGELGPIDGPFIVRRTMGLWLRWVYAETGSEGANRLGFKLLHQAEKSLDTTARLSRASGISGRVMKNVPWRTVAIQRRENYSVLAAGVKDVGERLRPLFTDLPEGAVPLGFPVVSDRRDSLKAHLIENHVYPPVHWDLPVEVRSAEPSNLVELSQRILTIPVDQRYTPEDMGYVLSLLTHWASRER